MTTDPSLSRLDLITSDAAAWAAENGVSLLLGLGAGAAIVALISALRSLGLRLCRTDRHESGWPEIVGRVIGRTKIWFSLMLAAALVTGAMSPPEAVRRAVDMLFTIAATLQSALWARELILGLIDRRAGNETDHPSLGSAMVLIRALVTAGLFAIALVLILDNLGVNVTGLIAGLGIGGIAIGLAAQGIFSDLFAALSIIFDKPFRVGELVKWDMNIGTVEKIGLKTTRVRSITGEQLIVSNAALLQKELRNLSNVAQQRVTLPFGIVYQTPPETCGAISAMVEEIVRGSNDCTFVRCSMSGFGTSSLDYELLFDIATHDPGVAAVTKSEVAIKILRAFNEAGIAFAYPTQTTFTAAPDGTMVMPWAPAKKA